MLASAPNVPVTVMICPDSARLTTSLPATGFTTTEAPAPVKFQLVLSAMPAQALPATSVNAPALTLT